MNRIERQTEGRRDFLRQTALAALALPFLINCGESDALAQKSETDILSLIKKNARPAGSEGMGAIDAPANVSWKTVLAKPTDEGEPMIISGTVFQADGKTPAPNVLIYLYHTDVYGIYGRGGEHKHGRFRGWLLSDEKGRYEFRSIRPASYPNSTISAHVHMTVTGKDFREDWIDSILFEGDRFITAREREQAGRRGGFNPIVRLEKGAADGVFRARRDIQLMG
jgi:protocatechuate 3,4-dioxygenase, beta subunit